MHDIRQSRRYGVYLAKIGWIVERIGEVNYFIKRLPLVGSIIKIQRPEKIDNNTIIRLSKEYRAFQIIVEPKNSARQLDSLAANSFRQSKSPFIPSKTLWLSLTKSEDQLLKGIKKDARSALRKTVRTGMRTVQGDEFRQTWNRCVGWKRYVPPLNHLIALKESFGNDALFLMEKEENAGAIFLVADKCAYYWQAFTDAEGRKLKAQYKIVWEGILWAKRQGAKIFDFEGIYDPRFSNKSWLGFTHFKKSFGGYEVEYPGAFVKNLLPFGL